MSKSIDEISPEVFGPALCRLRQERGLTQEGLAQLLHISAKTVSKWENRRGLPDPSSWALLAEVLKVDLGSLFQGRTEPNYPDVANLRKLKFYACPHCGNIMTGTGDANVSCCGRPLAPLEPQKADDAHGLHLEESDGGYYVTVGQTHPMTKDHYLAFMAYVFNDQLVFTRLYPEQEPTFRLPKLRPTATVYLYCVQDGLFAYRGVSLAPRV